MLDQLKEMAMSKLSEFMGPNSLDNKKTNEAANEGASELINSLSKKIKAGGLSEVTSLFSNDGKATEENPIFDTIKNKLIGILQNKGMDSNQANSEASNVAPKLIDSLKDKFLSDKKEDSAFDLNSLTSLVGGNSKGGVMNTLKGFFGK